MEYFRSNGDGITAPSTVCAWNIIAQGCTSPYFFLASRIPAAGLFRWRQVGTAAVHQVCHAMSHNVHELRSHSTCPQFLYSSLLIAAPGLLINFTHSLHHHIGIVQPEGGQGSEEGWRVVKCFPSWYATSITTTSITFPGLRCHKRGCTGNPATATCYWKLLLMRSQEIIGWPIQFFDILNSKFWSSNPIQIKNTLH